MPDRLASSANLIPTDKLKTFIFREKTKEKKLSENWNNYESDEKQDSLGRY